MKTIIHKIIKDTVRIDLKVIVPSYYYVEHFINGLNGKKWGMLHNPSMFADIYNKEGVFQFTLEQKEFQDHINLDISDDLNVLRFKTEYHLKYDFNLCEGSDWNEYALGVQKNHIGYLPTLFN